MKEIKIFIINLKQDTQKRMHMQKLCKQYALKVEFIDAIYGKDLSKDEIVKVYDDKKAKKTLNRSLSFGEIGCALSHKYIYKKMIDENIKNAIIFEDDIQFDESFITFLSQLNYLPENWELVLLCYYRNAFYKKNYCLRNDKRISTSCYKTVRFPELMHSTAAYIINLNGAKKLYDELEQGIYKPIDFYTGNDQYTNLYGIFPKLVSIDNYLGLQSSIKTGSNNPSKLKKLLKKFHLFLLFKKINLLRQSVQFTLESIFYKIFNFTLYLKKLREYK